MHKSIKMAVIAAGAAAMLGFAGCGEATKEDQYSSLLDKAAEQGAIAKDGAQVYLEKFKTMSAEQQQKEALLQ